MWLSCLVSGSNGAKKRASPPHRPADLSSLPSSPFLLPPSPHPAPYLPPRVFPALPPGAESRGPASPLLLAAWARRLSLLAMTLLVITTPAATIFTKINLYSRPWHGSSRASTPPCPDPRCTVRVHPPAAHRERDPRPRRGERGQRWGAEVSLRASEEAERPGQSGRRARVLRPRLSTNPYPNPGPPFPPCRHTQHIGVCEGQIRDLFVHLGVGAFLLTLAPLGARQECKGRRGVKYIYIHLYT